VSLTIRVDEDVYRDLTDVAKELGLSVNEIVNIYLSHLRHIMSIVKEDVDMLSKVFVDVPRDRLAVFSIQRVLQAVGNLYKVLKVFSKDLGLLEKGFTVEAVEPVIDGRENFAGVRIDFVASRYTEEKLRTSFVSVQIGHVEYEYGEPFELGGQMKAEAIVETKDKLGDRYKDIVKRLEEALNDEDVENALAEFDDSLGCDIAESGIEIVDTPDYLGLAINTIVDDYKCLPKLDEIEKIFDLILQKAGLKGRV
jgi:hypothetical protein